MKDDLLLIQQLKAQNKNALSALYDKYSGAIYGVIFRMCRDEALAEDILQETFLKIWQKAHLFNPEKGKFYTWALRIGKNTMLNSIRSQSNLIQNEDLSVYEDRSETPFNSDDVNLNGSIKKLEPHHQEAIELVYFKGLTHREAHKEMNVPLGTFKSYVRQALKQLRETYNNEEV